MAEKGLAGLRVRAVAQDAGITHATLHHYFPTKADLVRAVIDLAIYEGIARPLVEEPGRVGVGSGPMGPLEQLRRLLHGLVDHSGDDEGSAVLLELLRHGHAEDVVEPLRRYTEIWRGYLVDLLERAVVAGEARADLDADATAGVVIEVSLGLQTRAPLPEGSRSRAIDQGPRHPDRRPDR